MVTPLTAPNVLRWVGLVLSAIAVTISQGFPNSPWGQLLTGMAGLIVGGVGIRRPGDIQRSDAIVVPARAVSSIPPAALQEIVDASTPPTPAEPRA